MIATPTSDTPAPRPDCPDALGQCKSPLQVRLMLQWGCRQWCGWARAWSWQQRYATCCLTPGPRHARSYSLCLPKPRRPPWSRRCQLLTRPSCSWCGIAVLRHAFMWSVSAGMFCSQDSTGARDISSIAKSGLLLARKSASLREIPKYCRHIEVKYSCACPNLILMKQQSACTSIADAEGDQRLCCRRTRLVL